MNTDTGQVKAMLDLADEERESGKWTPISDELAQAARAVKLEEAVADLRAKQRQLEGLRKPGRR